MTGSVIRVLKCGTRSNRLKEPGHEGNYIEVGALRYTCRDRKINTDIGLHPLNLGLLEKAKLVDELHGCDLSWFLNRGGLGRLC